MIVVDTSALIAILLGEPDAEACMDAISNDDRPLISAGTVAEAMVVASARGLQAYLARIVDEVGLEIVNVTGASARQIGDIYLAWGKGHHPARLNLGDCFAYQLASERRLPLLYIGNDFARTDLRSVL